MYFGWLILATKKGRVVMFDLGLSTSSSGVDAGTKETLKAVDRQVLEMCRTAPSHISEKLQNRTLKPVECDTLFDTLRMENGGHHSLSYRQQAKTPLYRTVQKVRSSEVFEFI